MKQNQITMEIPVDALTAAHKHVEEIEALLPFLISLTNDEKVGGFKLGDVNIGFLTKSKDYMHQAPQFLPSFINLEESDRDTDLAASLFNFIKKLWVLSSKVEDTAMQAGFEALASALSYYNTVKMAAKSGVPGAQPIYDDLKKRFPGRPAEIIEPDVTKN